MSISPPAAPPTPPPDRKDPADRPERPEPDYARRQAAALAVLTLIALAIWGIVSAFDSGSAGHNRARTAAHANVYVPQISLLDALAPELQQSTGGSLTGNNLQLPLGRAIGQLFMVGFAGTDSHASFFGRLAARDWGVIALDSGNVTDTTQLKALTGALGKAARKAGHTPPLIAIRQAGGDQSVLASLPPAAEPDQGGTPAKVTAQTLAAGRALRGLGVNMDLAPDADLGYQGGAADGLAYGTDPATVAQLTVAALAGFRQAGVIPVVGHFPGQGAASQDPEQGQATVGLTRDQLQGELYPFAFAADQAPAMQMSNANYVALDPTTPASLSPAAYKLLRGNLHYPGIAISGNLVAASADSGTSIGDAAVKALQAGADLLYVPGGPTNQEQAYTAVLLAVRQGRLTPQRVATAVAHVLALKRAYGLLGR